MVPTSLHGERLRRHCNRHWRVVGFGATLFRLCASDLLSFNVKYINHGSTAKVDHEKEKYDLKKAIFYGTHIFPDFVESLPFGRKKIRKI